MKLGIENLLSNRKLLNILKKKRVALVCHPASISHKLEHSFDLLNKKIKLSAAFGPQHGIKGEKQDNMIESDDFIYPELQIPIFSLYGKVRRPTEKMMNSFDICLFDLQDLGCRIYTFITTLLYIMEECARYKKPIWILDRPNPAGRFVEGFGLESGYESFVGAAPIPMRHGLTVGELALYYKEYFKIDIELRIVKMIGYKPNQRPYYGWSEGLPWVNPSPNAATLNMARVYSGTVLLEGTHLSEGRGTTRALELVGAADIDFSKVHTKMKELAPQLMKNISKGCIIRECFFEPTFHKFQGQLCNGLQFHTDFMGYNPNKNQIFRIVALMLKSIRLLYPEYAIYRNFAYEYVEDKLPFDVINGGPRLRQWIEDHHATFQQLDKALKVDENSWSKKYKKYFLY